MHCRGHRARYRRQHSLAAIHPQRRNIHLLQRRQVEFGIQIFPPFPCRRLHHSQGVCVRHQHPHLPQHRTEKPDPASPRLTAAARLGASDNTRLPRTSGSPSDITGVPDPSGAVNGASRLGSPPRPHLHPRLWTDILELPSCARALTNWTPVPLAARFPPGRCLAARRSDSSGCAAPCHHPLERAGGDALRGRVACFPFRSASRRQTSMAP